MNADTVFHNRYKLKKFLGRGQFSEVWLAEDVATKIPFALKIYAPATGLDDYGVQMLAGEFSIVANANHENLLRPTYFDVCDRKPYLVLPFCEQGSSQKLIGKANEDIAWQYLHDVAAGLAYLHAYTPDPIIHQDIKPDNVMIGPHGQFMITDFGVSTRSKSALRRSVGAKGDILKDSNPGTIAYMGPERFGSDKTPIKASDIWSLGATVYELITGDVPFGENGGVVQASGMAIPTIKADISPDLRYAIRSCLHFHPWDRPTAETLVRWASNRKVDGKYIPTGDGKRVKLKCQDCNKSWETTDEAIECPECHSANISLAASSSFARTMKRIWWVIPVVLAVAGGVVFMLTREKKAPVPEAPAVVADTVTEAAVEEATPEFYCTSEPRTNSKPYTYEVTLHVKNKAQMGTLVYALGDKKQSDSVFNGVAPGEYSASVQNGGKTATQPLKLTAIASPVKPLTVAQVQSYLDQVGRGEMSAGAAKDKICRGEMQLASPVGGKSTLSEILHELELGAATGETRHYTVVDFKWDAQAGRIKSGTLQLTN